MRFFTLLLVVAVPCLGETISVSQVPPGNETPAEVESTSLASRANEASVSTQRNARTLTISVPAPRGLILDRYGEPFAQTEVAYHLALDFTKFGLDHSSEEAVAWAQGKIAELTELTDFAPEFSDQELTNYYRDRRWLPLILTRTISEKKAKALQEKLPPGLTLLPTYQRVYPKKESAAHLIGYVGTRQRLPKGPINRDDPLFESTQGKSGLELLFDDELEGRPGTKKLLFDGNGELLLEEWPQRPQAGGSVFTTLNSKWQRHAETVLRQTSRRGALIVIDVNSGEVLVLASRPSFDLNAFIPSISQENYDKLLNDPSRPLFGRAFQGEYPPASTFKPVVALAALSDGTVTPKTLINCPYKIKIGHHWFRNHSKRPEGPINVRRALARSTNPWFYQVGMKVGPTTFLSVARRLGFGSKSGLPLVGERAGLIPTSDYMLETHGRRMTDGDTANLSIGQGVMLATPLQIAQAMAGIANGGALPQLRLIRQIQDVNNRVVEAPIPEARNALELSPQAVKTVRKGMQDVIHASYGTGKEAYLPFTTMAGKTGTAQWGPASQNQRLAWFSGFFPVENPRYAFCVLYEGKPNQVVSGGKHAAPMVRNFFRRIRGDLKTKTAAPARAMIVVEEEPDDLPAPRAVPKPALPVEE